MSATPPDSPRLSVIIPALNESARIQTTLRRLAAVQCVDEIIVVDGGSGDDTAALAAEIEGVQVVTASRGRAHQQNAGAAAARASTLLFAHADAWFPTHAGALILEALEDPSVVGGAFRITTYNDGPGSWVDRWLWITDVRSHYTHAPYGDQGIFVRREVFESLGGFPEVALMEDLAFSRALRRRGRLVTLPAYVRVSGRRFVARPIRTLLLVNTFPLLHALGVPPSWLAKLYGVVR